MKINAKASGLAFGLLWGFNWFMLTWWMIVFEGITYETTLIGRIYRGFTISPIGSLVAFLWGFLDGFLLGLMFAWLYNWLSPRLKSKQDQP